MHPETNPKLLPWLAIALGCLDIAFSLGSYGFGLVNHYDRLKLFTDPGALIGITFALAGMLVGSQRPRHMMGWVYLLIAFFQGGCTFAGQYATYGLITQPGSLPFANPMSVLFQTTWAPGLGLLFTYAILLFPDGRLPSPRWRWLAWLSLLPFLLVFAAIAAYWHLGGRAFLENPNQFDPQGSSILSVVFFSFFPLMAICGFLSVLSLIVRFIHSRGIERLQIKWFTFAAAFTVTAIVATNGLDRGGWSDRLLLLPIVSAIPAAAGMAILRYHLFDIDLIIRRTLLYAIVSALLAAVYFGVVLLLQELFHALTGENSPVALVLSTLTIAALFTPLRRRVQQALDRRFYRQRYDAEQALAAFSSSLRSEVDFNQVSLRLLDTVQETVQPENTDLWIRKS